MRAKRHRIIVAVLGLAVLAAAFVLVKIVPARQDPAVDIQAEGRERALARSTLESELTKLFRTSNGRWRLAGRPRSQCSSKLSATSIARANTTTYEFAGWLGLRLFDYVYPSSAAAQRAFDAVEIRHEEACRARVFAAELLDRRYGVGKARRFSSSAARIADAARSVHFEIPSRYRGRSYDWHVDSTEVLRGRMILVAGTIVAGPFAEGDRQMAGDLAKAAGSHR
jgi:hypothetical protein